ncbi:hypothetical protein ACQWHS_25935, partial [Salmonella enterica subsp. enterica serovar Infantis]
IPARRRGPRTLPAGHPYNQTPPAFTDVWRAELVSSWTRHLVGQGIGPCPGLRYSRTGSLRL